MANDRNWFTITMRQKLNQLKKKSFLQKNLGFFLKKESILTYIKNLMLNNSNARANLYIQQQRKKNQQKLKLKCDKIWNSTCVIHTFDCFFTDDVNQI